VNKIAILLLAIAATLFGSSLSLIFGNFVSQRIPIELFSKSIPGVSDELVQIKTFDLIDFFLTILFTIVFFVGNYFILSLIIRKKGETLSVLTTIILLLFSIIIFIQTHFVSYSRTHIIALILLLEIVFLILSLIRKQTYISLILNVKNQKPELLFLIFSNGLLLGFFFLLILNQLTTIVILPLLAFAITPLIFLAAIGTRHNFFSKAVYSFPGLLILFSILFPTNLTKMAILGLGLFVIWFATFSLKSDLFKTPFFTKIIYPAAIIFLFVYNPTFYIGNFDPVEEGFFLGWLERLIKDQTLYKDVAVYHPPLLIWGMYFMSKLTGFSIYSERLFLHIMQILGSIIYFFFIRKVLNKSWLLILTLVLFFSFTSTLVRNNIEIRLAVGLLSLLFLFNFFQTKKLLWILATGIGAAVTIFTSLEIGLAIVLVLLIALNLFSVDKFLSTHQLKINLTFLGGLVIGSLPILFSIFIQGGLANFFDQLIFYSQAFSKGYFNVPIERAISLSFFHWHIFNQYLSSNAMFWELSRGIFISSLIYLFAKWFVHKEINLQEKFIFTTSLLGIILFRVALGRSDYYHLLVVLSISIIVFVYFLEKLSNMQPILVAVLTFALLFFFARSAVNSVFLENQFYKFQTYGKISGEYKKYSFPRGYGALIGSEINTEATDNLVEMIQDSTKKEDTIFVYPWSPELYFFADRLNATSFDTPYAFFSEKYQQLMINELRNNHPRFVIYEKDKNFGGFTPNALPLINKFILENYENVASYGPYQILKLNH